MPLADGIPPAPATLQDNGSFPPELIPSTLISPNNGSSADIPNCNSHFAWSGD